MKRILNVFLFMCLATLVLALGVKTNVNAAGETSTVTIHFAHPAQDYSDGGMHTWNIGNSDTAHASWPHKWDGTDEFGAYLTITIDSSAQDTIGYIALVQGMGNGTQWDHKSYGSDIMIDVTSLKAKGGQYDHIDVYNFYGQEDLFYAYPDQANILVAYYDASGAYEETLGMHTWGEYLNCSVADVNLAPGWASPALVFVDGFQSQGGTLGKATMFHVASGKSAGGLVYAGDDSSKKLDSDLFNFSADQINELVGKTTMFFVTNRAAYSTYSEFANVAFTFRIKDYGIDEEGNTVGTYTPNKTSIIVQFESAVAITEDIQSYFTLSDGANVAIERVDYDKGDASASEFVVVLPEGYELDNTKVYTLTYDDGVEGGNSASIEVNLDTQAPQIIVPIAPIEVEAGKPFDFALWPSGQIVCTDDRDNAVAYYCVAGDECVLDTNVPGEQKIKIYAADRWGNVSSAYITFNVVAPEGATEAGCATGAVVVLLSTLAVAASAFVVLRKRA